MTPTDRQTVKEALRAGTLRVKAVDPVTGAVALHVVSNILRHHTPHKRIFQVTTEDARSVTCTEDHSLFVREGQGVRPVEAWVLQKGTPLASVGANALSDVPVMQVSEVPSLEYTYDLSVPGPQNFVLTNGILAHNSYSIGGVSLDIEKSSKYESLKQNAESQFDKAAEAKSRTVKFMRGISQPKYGIGIRSSFGPATGRGVLSPRNFL